MKSNEYVRRFADHIEKAGERGDKARGGLLEMLFSEYNSAIRTRRIVGMEAADKVAREFNYKGRVIAQMINARRGKQLLRADFFIEAYHTIRAAEAEKGAKEETPE